VNNSLTEERLVLEKQVLSQLAVKALEDLKAHNIVCLNVEELTQITDYMIIATGNSTTHVKSLADEVERQVKAAGATVTGVEGRLPGEWVLVDLGQVIVHIMLAPIRALYSLEDLWNFNSADVAARVHRSDKGGSEA
jgi:ribosome-associated protein